MLFLFFVVCLVLSTKAADKYDEVVAADGSGNFKTVQAAIDAAPDGLNKPFKIFIKSGKYFGQIIIPAEKTFIELIGEDVANTIICYGDGKGGTSAFTINANNCMLMNLTLQNTQGAVADGPQSLAVRTNAGFIVFYNCRFISGQDTVMLAKAGRLVYFKDCYIDGNTDFIYGASVGVFDDCVIYCRDRVDFGKGGYLTAASTPAGQPYGLVFRNCIIPNNHGITTYTLGRPWQNDAGTATAGRTRAENKTVFLNTKMGEAISPQGWSVWNEGTLTDVITYAEYNTLTMEGLPADVSKRVPWAKQLSPKDAAPYFDNSNMFGSWNPYRVWSDLSKIRSVPLTATNFLARELNGRTVLQFNSSWPLKDAEYQLYKQADGAADFKMVTTVKANDDKTIAFQFADNLPTDNQTALYYIKAVYGNAVIQSDTLTVKQSTLLRTKWGKVVKPVIVH